MSRRAALLALRIVRFGLGMLGWLVPEKTSSLMLLDDPSSPSGPYLMRLFAVRDFLMGIEITATHDRELSRQLQLGIAVDLIDVTAGAIDGLTGRARPLGAVYRAVAGTIGASLGAAALGHGPLAARPPGEPPPNL